MLETAMMRAMSRTANMGASVRPMYASVGDVRWVLLSRRDSTASTNPAMTLTTQNTLSTVQAIEIAP